MSPVFRSPAPEQLILFTVRIVCVSRGKGTGKENGGLAEKHNRLGAVVSTNEGTQSEGHVVIARVGPVKRPSLQLLLKKAVCRTKDKTK